MWSKTSVKPIMISNLGEEFESGKITPPRNFVKAKSEFVPRLNDNLD